MQFGIEIPGYFKWSLYVYAQWAGLYENLGNTSMWGLVSCYPGRVGIMPEITVELKKRG
jgi:hypothetical protein